MAKSIIERIRAEKEARNATREGRPESSASEPSTGRSGQAPEIAFIEAFLTRFSAEVVPMVSKAMTHELQSALRPFYQDVRDCIRDSFDSTASEISKRIVTLEQYAATAATGIGPADSAVRAAIKAPPAVLVEAPSPAPPLGDAAADDDEGNADTDLEIPINELKRELERIIEDPAALAALAEEADDAGEHDTIILDAHEPQEESQQWTSATGVFADEAANLDELEGINNEELDALEEAATASDGDDDEAATAIEDTVAFETPAFEEDALEAEAPVSEGDDEDEDGNDTVRCDPIEDPSLDVGLETTDLDAELETDEVTDLEALTVQEDREEPDEQEESEPAEVGTEDEESAETETNESEPESEPEIASESESHSETEADPEPEAPAAGVLAAPGELKELIETMQNGQSQLVEKIEYIEVLVSANFESLVARVENAVSIGIKKATSVEVDS